MAMITDASLSLETEVEGVAFAREVLRIEAEALGRVRERLGPAIAQAADLIYRCAGSVIVTGMGKAGLVGQKLAATLASTGTRAFPLHPGEAIHGDLGRIRADDVVIALSQSGETEEVLRLVPAFRRLSARLIAITERATSSLGRAADLCIALGPIEEACPLGLSALRKHDGAHGRGRCAGPAGEPDARLFARGFRALPSRRQSGPEADPGRGRDAHRPAAPPGPRRGDGPRDLRAAGRPAPAVGAILIEDADTHLLGIFTDSDLARLFEKRRESELDRQIGEIMTIDPKRVRVGALLSDAVELLKTYKISELPVVDRGNRLVGLVDVTDLIGLVPAELEE